MLDAALHAYGESLPLLQLILINSLASLLGGMAPVPGGMGVIEAGLIGGFTAAGIPQTEAVAATFTHAPVHRVPAADLGLVRAAVAPPQRLRLSCTERTPRSDARDRNG